jgi:hypothetical protein
MSNRYRQLMNLMSRPQGCPVAEASEHLGITPAGCRGMIRDLKALLPVRTVYLAPLGRGKGQRAVHFIRAEPDAGGA